MYMYVYVYNVDIHKYVKMYIYIYIHIIHHYTVNVCNTWICLGWHCRSIDHVEMFLEFLSGQLNLGTS